MTNKRYKRLGDYIQRIDSRNSNSKISYLVGLSITKEFIPSVANIIGTDLSKYKVIRRNQFACSLMQVSRDGRIPIAKFNEDKAIISPAYPMFEVIDESKILPDYLMMWFSRSEFDREASYYAVGGVRGSLEWRDFCDMKLPIPSIEEQQRIVDEYQSIENKIKINEQICEKLEATAQALYRHWFVDFEFPHELVDSPPPEGCPQDGVVLPSQDRLVNTPQNEVALPRNTKNYMSLPYNPALKDRAKALRKAGNLAEVLFWKQVRNKQFLGLDFDRQKIVGNYIVDFYNADYQVVIEIDGSSHDDKEVYDAKRQTYLESLELTVLRFTDVEVKKQIDGVMRYLEDYFEKLEKKNLERSGVLLEEEKVHSERSATVLEQEKNHPAFQAPLHRRGSVGYKSSGGAMVWNEELEKEVPEGWEVKKLIEISNIIMGQSPKGETYNENNNGLIFYQGRTDFGFRIPEVRMFTTDPKRKAKIGDVLMSVRAPVGDLNIAIEDCCIGRGLSAIRSQENSFIFYLLKNFKQKFDSDEGTGTIFSSINKEELEGLSLIYNESVSREFHSKAKHLDEKIIQYSKTNIKLTQLQSLLLARMLRMEGKVK